MVVRPLHFVVFRLPPSSLPPSYVVVFLSSFVVAPGVCLILSSWCAT